LWAKKRERKKRRMKGLNERLERMRAVFNNDELKWMQKSRKNGATLNRLWEGRKRGMKVERQLVAAKRVFWARP